MGTLFSSREHGKTMGKQWENNGSKTVDVFVQNQNNESEEWSQNNGITMG
jgi:hypothetical protein